MSNKFNMTKSFLDSGLEKLKSSYKLTKQTVVENYEETLEAQKELILATILEAVNEHYSKLENARNGIKDPFVQKVAVEALREVKIDRLLVFSERSLVLPEAVELAISYGFMVEKASEEERIRAKLSFCDRVYRLVGTLNIADDDDMEREGEIHA